MRTTLFGLEMLDAKGSKSCTFWNVLQRILLETDEIIAGYDFCQ